MNLPNQLSLSRLFLALVNILLFFFNLTIFPKTNHNFVFIIMTIVFCLGIITDYLDGLISRKTNQVTNFGKFIDPIADKVLITSSLIILTLHSFVNPSFIIIKNYLWIITIIIIIRDIVVDFARIIAIKNNKIISASKIGKTKTIAQFLGILFLFINTFTNYTPLLIIGFTIMIFATMLTIMSGLNYLKSIKEFLK